MSPLAIDLLARTISGRAVPWNVVSPAARPKRAFHPDCLTWRDSVPLVIRHDKSQRVGKATHLEFAPDGLYATFRVRRDRLGDRALALAAAGWELSVGLGPHEFDLVEVVWITSAVLEEISLVPDPAFPQEYHVVAKPKRSDDEGIDKGGLIQAGFDGLDESSKAPSGDSPVFISEVNRKQIEETGEALDAFTGRTLTRKDLDAFNKAQQKKES